MELEKNQESRKTLKIFVAESGGFVKFEFSSGAAVSYPIDSLRHCSGFIDTQVCQKNKNVVLDLSKVGWTELVPHLLMFLEYICGFYEYPLSLELALAFLRFSEYFELRGDVVDAESYALKFLNPKEIHKCYANLWTFKKVSITVLDKTIRAWINEASCLDIIRLYLDWVDESSFKNPNSLLMSKPVADLRHLLKSHQFYNIDFPDKQEAISIAFSEYKVSYQLFDMKDLRFCGWLSSTKLHNNNY